MTPTPDFVAWQPLALSHTLPQPPDPSPMPPVPIPAGTPECKGNSLEAMAGTGVGATGHTNMPLVFRNRGPSLCFVAGYPDLTIVDASGRVLAQASGSNGRGTFFDSDWVEPILMQPGTAFVPSHTQLPQGQAFVNVEWWDCEGATAARIDITMPDGGGLVTAAYPIRSGYSPACDGGPIAKSGVFRGQFNPTGMRWPPEPAYIPVSMKIEAPASVAHGTNLRYFVTIQNAGTAAYQLVPCPDYVELLGAKADVATYGLNCGPAGDITPGRSVRFEMRLSVPPAFPTGPTELSWQLLDLRVAPSSATTPIAVT